VQVLDSAGAVLKTFAGLTGTQTTIAPADLANARAIVVFSVRDGDRSLQSFMLSVTP